MRYAPMILPIFDAWCSKKEKKRQMLDVCTVQLVVELRLLLSLRFSVVACLFISAVFCKII